MLKGCMYKATGRERERAQGETPGERRDKVRDRDRKTGRASEESKSWDGAVYFFSSFFFLSASSLSFFSFSAFASSFSFFSSGVTFLEIFPENEPSSEVSLTGRSSISFCVSVLPPVLSPAAGRRKWACQQMRRCGRGTLVTGGGLEVKNTGLTHGRGLSVVLVDHLLIVDAVVVGRDHCRESTDKYRGDGQRCPAREGKENEPKVDARDAMMDPPATTVR